MTLRRAFGCGALLVAATATATRANADGAFPNSQGILLPPGKPSAIGLVTNFGIVTSDDGGRSWLWSCEQDPNALGLLYQVSGPPRNRVYALANQQIVFSDDGTCGWTFAGGALGREAATDYFLDPSNPDRIVAVGLPDGGNYEVLESNNAGATFDTVLFQAAPGDFITGIEIAASDPRTMYLAMSRNAGIALGRSSDGGASWTFTDLTAELNASALKIISVDPDDPRRVVLLALQAGTATVVTTTDGGVTVGAPLPMPAVFTSFARLSSGTLLIGGALTAGGPLLLRSRDRGKSFQPVTNPPVVLGLAARATRAYAALNYMSTQSALSVSDDEGTTWTKIMTFSDVRAILPCVKDTCRSLCEMEANIGIWPPAVCSAVPSSTDGGAGSAGGAGTAGHGGDKGPGQSSNHACQVAGRIDPWHAWGALPPLLALWFRRRGARRGA